MLYERIEVKKNGKTKHIRYSLVNSSIQTMTFKNEKTGNNVTVPTGDILHFFGDCSENAEHIWRTKK